jgi:hypothetical protein
VRWLDAGLFSVALAMTACGTMRSAAERCPNWNPALSAAQALVPCDRQNRAEPGSECLAALLRCEGGCDVCQFLGGPGELEITIADEDEWAPITRVPIDSENPNGYRGKRARQEPGFFSRTYKLNWHLCTDRAFVDVLASTLVHEAMHECVSVRPPGIFDHWIHPAPGCSAEELENVCVAK